MAEKGCRTGGKNRPNEEISSGLGSGVERRGVGLGIVDSSQAPCQRFD
jgi:hypothetical protein